MLFSKVCAQQKLTCVSDSPLKSINAGLLNGLSFSNDTALNTRVIVCPHMGVCVSVFRALKLCHGFIHGPYSKHI